MNKLFNVTCEIILDAEDKDDAIALVRKFLGGGNKNQAFNFLVHYAEEALESSLAELREHQDET